MKLTSGKIHQATVLVAEDRLTDEEIAGEIGIRRSTLAKWKSLPKFAAQVSKHAARLTESAMQHGIARKENRVRALQRRHNKLLQVLEERAKDPTMQSVPGGNTGLLVRRVVVSSGKLMGYEYAVDIGTLRELRGIEYQVAKELGQIVDKRELTGRDGGPVQHENPVEYMTDDEIEAELGKMFRPARGPSASNPTIQ